MNAVPKKHYKAPTVVRQHAGTQRDYAKRVVGFVVYSAPKAGLNEAGDATSDA